ncbi:recombinase family protein [Nonomuraea roseoviolacea]|uniref:DNA invertase Pin-like site-specific DNA recombinase n=1 Tax=Nonomuraea roseoviolacea subsp. carminata TaxID=160689 RepID=A0ABT1K346_9ACTN|nr:recombinase family protein [Nonomuraea roseoviolacea]MCP2348416.1 DNA invertase Pin-like site-specific DNA recombinase [Nonomuraea roseoviolacea subsp. carminata]
MIENPRILGVIRLSVTTDASTAPERQRAAIEHWASSPYINGTVIGWAEDLDVSGGLDPFKRPKLGPWLRERANEFDVVAVLKIDRLTRRSKHFAEMMEWCQERGKTIVSVTEGIDMSTPMGKMFAQIIAAFAEGELDTIRARVQASAQTRLEMGVWTGGVLPFGYQFVDSSRGKGKKLAQDPEYAALLREIVDRIKADWSAYRIAVDLNQRNVPTWRDYLRIKAGKPARGIKWNSSTIVAIATNPTAAGFYTYKGQQVEDEEGNPIMIASDPIMTAAEWNQMVVRFTTDERKAVRSIPSRSMLGGVAICGLCGANLSSAKKTKQNKSGPADYFYYTCNNLQNGTCTLPGRAKRPFLDDLVNETITRLFGGAPVFEKSSVDSGPLRIELDAVRARLDRLEGDYMAGMYDGEGQDESYWKMHKNLSAKVSRLRAEVEVIDSSPRYLNTGRTYGEVWSEKDDEQKRAFLKKHNITIAVFKDLVDHSRESVVIEFKELGEIVRENNLLIEDIVQEGSVYLNASGFYRYGWNTPIGDDGSVPTVEQLRKIAKRRVARKRAAAVT